ncbi:NfrA family protein [Beijerinckia mobilis]|uniref:NfrA family protein n=1 Tax=Beijerinckia mobilis TaxID=231434 RepID=UPI000553E80F|nr:tetratricopeptide repeat protein [Beijerinckia mobilis]
MKGRQQNGSRPRPGSFTILRSHLFGLCGAFAAVVASPGEVIAQADVVPLPLSGPAFRLAEEAQLALTQGDYDKALASAREGLRQRPDAPQFRLYIVQALERSGRLDEAETEADRFVAGGDGSRALLAVLAEIRRVRGAGREGQENAGKAPIEQGKGEAAQLSYKSAQEAFEAAHRAFAQGDYAAALLAARQAAAGSSDQTYADFLKDMQDVLAATRPGSELPSFQAAEGAYRAFAQRNYREAHERAQEAVRLEPDNPSYQKLLATTEAALLRPPEKTVPPPPGYRAAAAAYGAMREHAYARAASLSAMAVREAPGNAAYRALLVDALTNAGRLGAAEQAAGVALTALGPAPRLYAMRANLRLRLKKPAEAAEDFAAALALPGASIAERRSWRVARVEALIQAARSEEALAALSALDGDGSFDASIARGNVYAALQQEARRPRAIPFFSGFDAGIDPVERAPSALSGGNAEVFGAYALAAFNAAAEKAHTRRQKVAALGGQVGALNALGESNAAQSLYEGAERVGLLDGLDGLERAYLAERAGAHVEATRFFAEARASGELKGNGLLDAGYASMRAFDNQAAIDFFKAGVDAARSGVISMTPQQIFQVKRQISDLDRQWGINAVAAYGAVGTIPNFLVPLSRSTGDVAQVGGEVYWRPPAIGYRDRTIVELFARAFETVYDQTGGATGTKTIQVFAGARGKPFADLNLILEGAHMWNPGGYGPANEWMLRAAFSQGEGLDLRYDMPSWFMWNFYGEVVRYVVSAQTIANYEWRAGESFRIDGVADGLVLTPHVALGGRYDNVYGTPWALGIGPGIAGRLWFRGDDYHAPHSFVDVSVQYRFHLAGGQNARGLFAQISVAY